MVDNLEPVCNYTVVSYSAFKRKMQLKAVYFQLAKCSHMAIIHCLDSLSLQPRKIRHCVISFDTMAPFENGRFEKPVFQALPYGYSFPP